MKRCSILSVLDYLSFYNSHYTPFEEIHMLYPAFLSLLKKRLYSFWLRKLNTFYILELK